MIVRSATKHHPRSRWPHDQLKVIGRAGVGVDTIDVDAATEKGIAVMNAPAGNTISAAELAFALLLALVRRGSRRRSLNEGRPVGSIAASTAPSCTGRRSGWSAPDESGARWRAGRGPSG